MTNPIAYGTIRYSQRTETTGTHDGLGEIPLKVSVIGTTMKKTTAIEKKTKWAKCIIALEKHVAKKKLRDAHKLELKKFDFGEITA